MAEIDSAMNRFCDLLEDVPGIKPMRPDPGSGTTKGGWYYPHFRYVSEELGGLSLSRFAEAVRAEGSVSNPGCNKPLHRHPLFTEMDVYGHGRPTRIAHLDPSARVDRYVQSLPVAEGIMTRVFEVPWFKHDRAEVIEQHARAYRKVVVGHAALLSGDKGDATDVGGYSSFFAD